MFLVFGGVVTPGGRLSGAWFGDIASAGRARLGQALLRDATHLRR
jgi:hypothetical protein